MNALKKAAFFCALLLPVSALAQTTVSGNKVLDNAGALLASGQWCFGATCFTVTSGAFSGSVTSGTATVTVVNGATTYLTVPNVTIAGSYFSWDTYTVPSNGNIYGLGAPRLACAPGALYSQTDGAQNKWQCISQNGAGVWNGLPAPGTQGTVAIGQVSTLAPTAPATVVNVGTGNAAILNFGIPKGLQGTANWRGSWAASTAYAPNDGFVNSGTGYIVVTAYTSGSSFGSLDTTNAIAVATGLPTTGGILTGPLTSSSTVTSGNVNTVLSPAACGSIAPPSWCSGSTPDAWVTSACSALPSTGGVIDLQGFGANTELAITLMGCGSSTKPVHFIGSWGTTWEVNSTSQGLFKYEPGNTFEKIHFGCANQPSYSGSVFQNDTSAAYGSGAGAILSGIMVDSSCVGVSSGTAILENSTSSSTGISQVIVRDSIFYGLQNAIVREASNSGFVTANNDVNVQAWNQARGWSYIRATHGYIGGNSSIGGNCEAQSGGTGYCIYTQGDGSSGSNIQGNYWQGTAFDYTNWGDFTAAYGTDFENNKFDIYASGSPAGSYPPGATTDTGYNTLCNLNFAGVAPLCNFGSNEGIWVNSAAGFGFRDNDVTHSTAWDLHPDLSNSNLYDVVKVGVGTAVQLYGAGAGGIIAGSGSGAFQGGVINNPSDNPVIPLSTLTGSGGSGTLFLLGQTCVSGSITPSGSAGGTATGTCTLSASATGHTGFAAATDGSVQGGFSAQVSVSGTTATVTLTTIAAGSYTAKSYNVTVF